MIKQHTCNINERNRFGYAALHLSCFYIHKRPANKHEYLKIVRELVENEMVEPLDINAQEAPDDCL